jgi:hypothetical protein
MITKERIKELITKRIQETSATGTGASFATGEGENYSTPVAGKAKNYYYKLGFKPVNQKALNKKAHGIDVKHLWEEDNSKFDVETYIAGLGIEDEDLKKFITKRLLDFDIIEDNLKTIIERLKHAKLETQQTYKQDPSYTVLYSTDLIKSSLEDILTLLKANEDTSRTV